MKYKKTEASKRGTYTYSFYDVDGRLKRTVLKAGEYGVSADNIKCLHSFEDAEVYNNIKNNKPKLEDWQKQIIEEWKLKHPYEESPQNWNTSLDAVVDEERHSELKEFVADENTLYTEESDLIFRLHEIVDSFTELQKEIYHKVILDGMSNSSVAKELGKSETAVRKTVNKIKQIIVSDKKIKKYFE